MKKKGRKTPLLPSSHITHHVSPNRSHPQGSITLQALHPCFYLLPTTAKDKKCQNIGRRRHHLHSMSGLKAGLVAKLPPTVHFPSGAHLGLDSGRTAQGRLFAHSSFQGYLHYLLCLASCKAAAHCPGPLHTSGHPGAQAAPSSGDDGATQPWKCLFWPDLTFLELV